MEPGGSLPHSQVPAVRPYPETDQSIRINTILTYLLTSLTVFLQQSFFKNFRSWIRASQYKSYRNDQQDATV
jgi:hypothetical protein